MLINLLNPLVSGSVSSAQSDEEIVDMYIASQSPRLFDILYDRYSKKVFVKCNSLLRDQAKAEDAMQEIFIKVLLNLSKFNKKAKFSTWLYSITYNYCIDSIRKGKKRKSVSVEDVGELEQVPDTIDDKRLLETNIVRLKAVLDKIPTEDKAILLMKYQDDMSIKEIGSALSKSESAVKMKIKRAKEKFVKQYSIIYQDAI